MPFGNPDTRVEGVARAQEPVTGFAGEVQTPPSRHRGARSRELRTARDVSAIRAGIQHGRRVVGGTSEGELFIHRVGALCVCLPEGQVLLDDVAVDRQEAVLETVDAEHRVGAAVEAAAARIPVDYAAEVEGERTEGRPETGGTVNFGCCPVRKRDAGARGPRVELEVRADVIPRLEVGICRRIVIGLGDAAEDVVALDTCAKGEVPGFGGGAGGGALTLRSAASAGVASATAATTDNINFFIWCPFSKSNATPAPVLSKAFAAEFPPQPHPLPMTKLNSTGLIAGKVKANAIA